MSSNTSSIVKYFGWYVGNILNSGKVIDMLSTLSTMYKKSRKIGRECFLLAKTLGYNDLIKSICKMYNKVGDMNESYLRRVGCFVFLRNMRVVLNECFYGTDVNNIIEQMIEDFDI